MLTLIFTLLTMTSAEARGSNRVVLTVDLGRRIVTIYKFTVAGKKPLARSGPSLAVVPGSIRTGTFRARLPFIGAKGERGASHLDHALLFDGMHVLRSSEHFEEMKAHSIAGSVVLDGEFGGVVHAAVRDAGGVATLIVRP